MNNIFFHIIIPTYNREKLILRALKSVLNQKYDNYYIYIIDDGSIDNTKEILETYLKKNSNKITYKYKENGGVGSARNVGIELALKNSKDLENDWVIFLDSDDELIDNALNKVYKEIINFKDADLIRFKAKNQNGKITCKNCKIGISSYSELISGCSFGECFSIGKLKIFNNYKFIEEINGGENLLRWDIYKKYKIFLSNELIRIYHQENEGLTRKILTQKDIKNQIKILNLTIKKYKIDLEKFNKNSLKINYFVLARMKALNGERLESIRLFISGLKYGFYFKGIILYFLSLLPFGLKINNFLIKLSFPNLK